ncbi:DUF563 domain-containing protein [Halorubrum sp. AJ67]|uniref:glycosyltransferase family 61 protein n=1 Tax=Halorubrum sp. AJ67 TaxID=1173487 RepID=UPI0018965BA3|nr:glycosyltransferase family 61 protein [Halorubrum sp. AJ67]
MSRKLYKKKKEIYGKIYQTIQHPLKSVVHQKLIRQSKLKQVASKESIIRFGKREQYQPDLGRHEWIVKHCGTRGPQTFPRPFTCVIDDAKLVGSYPIPLTNSHRCPLDAIGTEDTFNLNLLFSLKSIPGEARSYLSKNSFDVDLGFLMYDYWSSGYFHWHFDNLIQLRGLEAFESTTGRRPKLIVPPDLSDWQQESLEIMGYDEDDLVRWEPPLGTVEELVVVTNQRPRPDSVRWLRQSLDITNVDQPSNSRIYVSRSDADRRRVLNEEEVMACLSQYGFDKFVPGNHTVRDQIRTMKNAEVVVGPHGAGLTNILHCPEDTNILELLPKSDPRRHFFDLANKLNLNYSCCLCDDSGTDLVVDVEALHQELQEVLDDS